MNLPESTYHGRLVRAFVAAAAGLLATGAAPWARAECLAGSESTAAYTLRPVAGDGEVAALEIALCLTGAQGGTVRALLEMPLVTTNVPTIARSLDWVDATDAAGAVRLEGREEGEGLAAIRRWYPARSIDGPVLVRYTVKPVDRDAPLGAAPPLEPRAEAGAISGGAATVLLRPLDERAHLELDWDLSSLPSGATALNSPLPDDPRLRTVGLIGEIYYMAGRLRQYPGQRAPLSFFSAWQGDPPFDARALMEWTGALYLRYEQLFGTEPEAYGVFMRRNPVNPGGGMGMNRSFIVTFGENGGNDPEDLKLTLAHEMFHTFQPLLTAGDEAGGPLAASWFNEGLATYYQRELPFRWGLIDADRFLADLNFHAARYYTNALGDTPNSQVPAGFWKDTRIRTVPYDRGFLYFATVDEAMRRASGGKRSLDDLMLAIKALEARSAGGLHAEDWSELLRRELGSQAVIDFERVQAGGTPFPGTDAFGPCFRRVSKPLRRYELGFEPAALTESPRVVRGLVPGSAAEAAGLRDGDEIVKPVPQDRIQGTQGELLRLAVRRAGATIEIAYLPRGEDAPAWHWERTSQTSGASCTR